MITRPNDPVLYLEEFSYGDNGEVYVSNESIVRHGIYVSSDGIDITIKNPITHVYTRKSKDKVFTLQPIECV